MELKNYYLRPEEEMALKSILKSKVRGARTLLIEGAPGVGKTYFGQCLAEDQGWELVFYQCHSWSSDQELFNSINVSAAVSGDAENIIEKGRLLEAAEKSHSNKVVLIIDELDKAPELVDSLLYDFLQYGRVPAGQGKLVQANLDNLVVIITTNKQRELNEAIIRRCRRLSMKELPKGVLVKLIMEATGFGHPVARKICIICQKVASVDNKTSSLQEMTNLAEELQICENHAEVMIAVSAWAVKGPLGAAWLESDGSRFVAELVQLLSL